MELSLNGLRVLVTGSSRGIGYGIANAYLEEGAFVVLTGRDEDKLNQARACLVEKYGANRIDSHAGDLCDRVVRGSLLDLLASKGLDSLVCNIGSGKSVPAMQETDEEWRRMLDINLVHAAGLVKELHSLLAASVKQGRNASVTFIGSICGMESLGCPIPYASAKAALWAYTKSLVGPLAKDGIRVNMVSPGNILFSGSTWESKLAENEAKVQEMVKREVPLCRFGTVKEVSAAVVFLASQKSAFITGANLVIDGGQTRGL